MSISLLLLPLAAAAIVGSPALALAAKIIGNG
jgi:hypothetical protein